MQKRIKFVGIILVAILISTFLLIRPIDAEEKEYQDISVQQAKRMIKYNSKNLVILDVRNQSEYDLGRLYNAVLVPVYEVENSSIPVDITQPIPADSILRDVYLRANSRFKLSEHIDDNILVYCAAGSRSEEACQILVEHGFSKVYNMLGGISAWMQADYPIYTSNHHVAVDFLEYPSEIQFDIEPMLLYQENCISCQNQDPTGSGSIDPTNVTTTVLEENENHTLILVSLDINGTIIQHTVEQNLLWRYNELTNKLNRTVSFTSIAVTKGDETTQNFRLSDEVKHEDYELTASTILISFDQNKYNRSFTVMNYAPTGKTEIRSSEWVDFDEPVTLSQLYSTLGKASNEIADEYKKSKDKDLKEFSKRYRILGRESKLLSTLVNTHLAEYDQTVFENVAVIMDDWVSDIYCGLCKIGCQFALLYGCVIVCACTVGTGGIACAFCYVAMGYIESISAYGCELFCMWLGCSTWGSDPYYNYVSATSEYEYYATVSNHEYLQGDSPDGNYAYIYAGNPPGMGQILAGCEDLFTHGQIQIYGKSAPGYSSDLYVYVSVDGQNYDFVKKNRVTATSPYWIDFGYVDDCFSFMAIVGYDSALSVKLYLDCVRITP